MYEIYRMWEFLEREYWRGYVQFYADYLPQIFPSLDGICGRDLRPLIDSIWDQLLQALATNAGCLGVKNFCSISGPLNMMGNIFKGDGLLIETESGDIICVFPMRWGFNVYPEDREFWLNTNPYFISQNKSAVKDFLEKFVKFSKNLSLEILLNAAWKKFERGIEDYERTGGEYGFNQEFNGGLIALYKSHLNRHTGRYIC